MLSGSRLAIDRALEEFLQGVDVQLSSIDPELVPVSSALKDFLSGGKRLRPLFAFAGYVGAGGDGSEPFNASIIKALSSLELLQACALIHDDMMDGSDSRRGAPSMHRRFESAHRDRSGNGQSADFGNAAALLIGDLALVLSTQALNESGISDVRLREAHSIFDVMKVELMAGQYLDMHAGSQHEVSIPDALKIATYKSGKYTIERPLHFGAALAGGGEAVMAAYSNYGIPLGIAFQLRDDLLGVFGDSALTGKPAGDDLREGKRTALISYVLEKVPAQIRDKFLALFGRRDASESQVKEMREVVQSSGAVEFIEKIIDEQTALALAAAKNQNIAPAGRDLLTELAIKATQRSA